MNNTEQAKMKFDRRLAKRRDWLAPGELEAELGALPDAADKVFDETEEPEPVQEAAPVEEAPSEEPAAIPTPAPSPFGTPS